MTSNYKKYSLEKLQDWVHDALSCGEASPHEIYSAIREIVQEDYLHYKNHSARAFGLLELLSGHRPVADDEELYEAAIKEREYYEGVKKEYLNSMYPDVPEDGSPVVFDYTATGEKFPTVCDKDDPSPECKGAWNDFWEENYYPEEYKGSTVSSVKESKKKWVLPVEEVKDEDTDENVYCVSFPDDLLEAAKLKEGDLVEWVDLGNGSYRLEKVPKAIRMDEC